MPFIAILHVCCSPNPLQERSTFYYSPMPFIAILNVCCSPNPLQERSFHPKRAAIKKIVAEGDLYYSPMPFIAILNVCGSPNRLQERSTFYYSPMPFIAILTVCCSPNPLQERSFLPKPLRGNSFPEVDWESGKTHRGAVTRLGEQ